MIASLENSATPVIPNIIPIKTRKKTFDTLSLSARTDDKVPSNNIMAKKIMLSIFPLFYAKYISSIICYL